MSAHGLFRSAGYPIRENEKPGDSLLVLYQRTRELCVSAIDPYEIAVHLEAMGYNRYRVQKEFGLDGVFQLAEKLYALVPRDFPPVPRGIPPLQTARQLAIRYLVVLSTFLAILFFHLRGGGMGWPVAIWLLAWGQMGYFLVYRAEAELAPPRTVEAKTSIALLGLGVAAVLSFMSPNPWDTFSGSVFWVGAIRAFWDGRVRTVVLSAIAAFLGAYLGLERISFLSAGLLSMGKFLVRSCWNGWQWLLHSWPRALYPFLYGLGQGLFLYGAFHRLSFEILWQIMVFLVAWLFFFDFALHRFGIALNRSLWGNTSFATLFSGIRSVLLLCIAILLLPLAVSLGLLCFLSSAYVPFLLSGFWAVITGSGVFLFSLGEQKRPAMVLFVAGVTIAIFEPLAILASVVAMGISLACLSLKLCQPLGYGLWFL